MPAGSLNWRLHTQGYFDSCKGACRDSQVHIQTPYTPNSRTVGDKGLRPFGLGKPEDRCQSSSGRMRTVQSHMGHMRTSGALGLKLGSF